MCMTPKKALELKPQTARPKVKKNLRKINGRARNHSKHQAKRKRSNGVPVHVPHHVGVQRKSEVQRIQSDESWKLVVPKKPLPEKAVIYVGNLSPETTEYSLISFITQRSERVDMKAPTVYNCRVFSPRTAQTLRVAQASPFRWTQWTSWQMGLFGPDQPMPGGGFSPNQQATQARKAPQKSRSQLEFRQPNNGYTGRFIRPMNQPTHINICSFNARSLWNKMTDLSQFIYHLLNCPQFIYLRGHKGFSFQTWILATAPIWGHPLYNGRRWPVHQHPAWRRLDSVWTSAPRACLPSTTNRWHHFLCES